MYKVLVSDNLAQEGIDILQAAEEIDVEVKLQLSYAELKAIIGEYDSLLVRSGTKVTEDIIAAGKKLKVIGRAGAGVDNINVEKATSDGIVVMNTPSGNTISTAEHVFCLMLVLSRNISQADSSMKAGQWERKKYTGVELRGKTLGIIGLGNVGRVVADRAVGLEMKVLGVDPFISKKMAQGLEIELTTLDEIWTKADYISVHTSLNEGTYHLINAETLAKCKDGVRIINCAHGSIINEDDLLRMIDSGKVAGAALDVFEKEPPEHKIAMHEKVVCTPHLGASTTEAQDIVSVMIAEQIRDFLLTGEVRNAVNIPSISSEIYIKIKPFIVLSNKMVMMLGQLCKGQFDRIDVTYYGDVHNYDIRLLTSSVLDGLFRMSYAENVNMINARSIAEKLGLEVHEIKSSDEKEFKDCIEVTVYTNHGDMNILGTILGKNYPHILRFQEFELDFIPEGHVLITKHNDRPGIIGKIGTVLGEKNINIAQMALARNNISGEASVVLNTDDIIDKSTLDKIMTIKDIDWVACLEL